MLNNFLEAQKQKYESEFENMQNEIGSWKQDCQDSKIEKMQTEKLLKTVQDELKHYKLDYERQSGKHTYLK